MILLKKQKKVIQQYQKTPINSGIDDTLNQLKESTKEINVENTKNENIKSINKTEISNPMLMTLKATFEETDILATYAELQQNNNSNPSFGTLSHFLQQCAQEGKIKKKKIIDN